MENDDNQRGLNIIEEKEQTLENIFKLDYYNQNVSDNIEFQKWKNVTIKKYGNN